MIPILYSASETQFTSNGLGRLIDATKCEVTEERNGQYELVMEYPVDGTLYDQLIPGNYIAATHEDSNDIQPFQIYQISAPLQGLITINAWHISYLLNNIIVEPFTAASCLAALSGLSTNSMNTNPFTFWTDKSVSANFSMSVPASARSLLGGSQGSILDVYGSGEYEFDKWNVKLHASRGTNNGVALRYGKNIKSLDYQLDATNQYNAVVPYWTNGEVSVYVDHIIIRTGQTADRVIALDLSSEFEEQPTAALLETAAQAYIDASTNYQIKDNLTIDFVPIWEFSEYQFRTNIEKIKLCDTVTIIYGRYNINATAKVIKTTFDALRGRYTKIELGEPKTTLSQQIQQDVSSGILNQIPDAIKRMVNNNFDYTGWESATGTSGVIDIKTYSITEPGVYLVCACGYQSVTGYTTADRALMTTAILAFHYSGGVAQSSYSSRAPMTGGGDCSTAAMFQCAAGDSIVVSMQQAKGGGSTALASQTFYAKSSLIRLS